MSAEPPIDDDPVIRRVAAIRPPVAEEDLSPAAPRARAIAQRVLATPAEDPAPSPRRPRRLAPRMGVAIGLATAVAVVVLALVGVFSGPGDTGTEPAAAAVTRAAVHALTATPGTIFVEEETHVSGPTVHGRPYTTRSVLETPTGPAPQNYLVATDLATGLGDRRHPLTGYSFVGGTEAIYTPATHTVYESSIWGPYLHPGSRPGTFVYRTGPGAPAYATHPVPITAAQRRGLLSGRLALRTTARTIRGKVYISGLKVLPPLHAPDPAQTLREEVANHMLRFVRRTTVDGRPALELAGTTNGARSGDAHIYLDPETHLPFREVDRPGTGHQQVVRLRLRKLPITPVTRRLLSLRALHPTARVDRDHRDYLRAIHGNIIFNQ